MSHYNARLNGLSFEMAGPEDTDALLQLINLIQPHVPWDEAMLNWQYFQPPAGHARIYICRNQAHDIIAQYVAVPYHFRLNDRETNHMSWMIQDVMTHPDYRGRGILHELGRRCITDIRDEPTHFAHTFPNEKSNGSFGRNGWHQLMQVPARQYSLESYQQHNAVVLVEVDDIASLDLVSPTNYIGVERSNAYLTWRYSKPGCNYRFWQLPEGGWAITKLYVGATERVFHILDMCLLGSPSHQQAQLLTLFDEGLRQQAQMVTCWAHEESCYTNILADVGLNYPSSRREVYIYVDGDGPSIRNPGRWWLTQGDSDVY